MKSSLINLNKVKGVNEIPDTYWEIITKKLGGVSNVEKLIRGQLFVELKDVLIRFDKYGRLIPPLGLENSQCSVSRSYHIKQPHIDWAGHLNRLRHYLRGKISINLSSSEYQDRGSKILERIRKSESFSKILNGPYVIGVIPKLPEQVINNYGKVLADIFLPAVKKAHNDIYVGDLFVPKSMFKDYMSGRYNNQITVAENTHYDLLLQKAVENDVVFVHFLQPLYGYSVNAQREVIQMCPESVVLSGAIDTACSLIQFTPELESENELMFYDCSANKCTLSDISLYFVSFGGKLSLVCQNNLEKASNEQSGGLLFLG